MGKLHQLLAVESDLENQYKLVLEETRSIFDKKLNLFFGFVKSLKMFNESDNNQ